MAITESLEIVIGADTSEVEKALGGLTGKAKAAGQALGRAATSALAIGTGMAAAFTAGGLALKEALDAGSQMEAFESRLSTLMGSSEAARGRMAELFDFAATTPFELDQVVAAEVTMRGFGADTEALMTGLIDLAAGTGGDLNQLAIDFGKAWTQGAAGMESDIGRVLRAQMQARSDIALTDLAIEDFRTLMQETLSEGMFAGGAAKLSQTFSGMVSNLSDEWSRFKLEVANAGVFDNVKEVLRDTLALIGQNREEIAKMAGIVSDVLWFGFKSIGMVAAGILDTFYSWKSALFAVGSVAATVDQTVSNMGVHMLDTMTAMAGALGNTELRDALGDMAYELDDHARSAGRTAEEMRTIAIESANSTDNAMRMAAYFASLEKSSAATADSTREIAEGTGGTSGGTDATSKAAQDDLLKRFEAAQAFQDEMAALDDSAYQAEVARYQARLAELESYYDQALLTGQAYQDTLTAIEQDHATQVAAIQADIATKLQEQREQELAAERAAAQERIQLQSAYANAAAGVFGTLADLSETFNEDNKAAQKRALTAQALMSTYASAATTAASVPFPANIPLVLAAVGQGLAQVAMIQKQHQGGVTYAGAALAPDEVPTVRLGGEASLSRATTRAIGGEQGVNALEAGRIGPTSITLRVGRVAQQEVVRTNLQGNSPLQERFRQNRTTGVDLGMRGGPVPA
jgi:hypothetical protein